jgi:CRISPR-associated protein Cmr3
MPEKMIQIRGLDPSLLRDGRPFTNSADEVQARTLEFPTPGMVAGFIRSRLYHSLRWEQFAGHEKKAIAVEYSVAGPLLVQGRHVVFPAPGDALIVDDDKPEIYSIIPESDAWNENGAGCDFPIKSLRPTTTECRRKPAQGCRYWRSADLLHWLENSGSKIVPQKIEGPVKEKRTGISIDPNTGITEEGMLYGIELTDITGGSDDNGWKILAKVGNADHLDLRLAGPMGGEMRPGIMEPSEDNNWPDCPESLKQKLAGSKWLRMVLAAPAIFSGGWRPGWLDENLEGSPPFTPGLRLRLVSAIVPRRQAVSGWSYGERPEGHAPGFKKSDYRGKPVRWMAPAGSVYFFETLDGDPVDLIPNAWLRPVSDDPKDKRDGYGLALWGIWSPKEENK